MPATGDSRGMLLAERIEEARQRLDGNVQRLARAQEELRSVRAQILLGRSERQLLHDSAYARLEARLASMPVIEQAKGIVMAQSGCGPDHAFDLLVRASQRSNVKLRDLAAEIVRCAVAGRPDAGPGRRDAAAAPGRARRRDAADRPDAGPRRRIASPARS